MALLEASGIGKNFGDTHVLKDISLTLEQGEALAIIGSSGSGKTTLLRCLNFLERPDTGVIKVNGETMWDAADPATQRESEVRKKRLHFGLVFQNFNLFPQYTALQNVMLAGELLARERPDYKANKKAIHAQLEAQARDLLAQMGLADRAGHYPHQLSGGMRQRVMIAMALACKPRLLLADEPTTALDVTIQGQILALLGDLSRERGMGLLLITHDLGVVAEMADEVGVMYAGRIVERAPVRALFAERAIPILGALSAPRPRLTRPLRRSWTPSPAQSPRPAISRRGAPSGRAARKRMNAASRLRPSSNPPGPTAPGRSAAGLPKQGKCCRIRVQSYIECWQMRHGDGASPNMIIKELA